MKLTFRLKGGPGSGNKGHAGIPGHYGGSAPKGGGRHEPHAGATGSDEAMQRRAAELRASINPSMSAEERRSIRQEIANLTKGGGETEANAMARLVTESVRHNQGDAVRKFSFDAKGNANGEPPTGWKKASTGYEREITLKNGNMLTITIGGEGNNTAHFYAEVRKPNQQRVAKHSASISVASIAEFLDDVDKIAAGKRGFGTLKNYFSDTASWNW